MNKKINSSLGFILITVLMTVAVLFCVLLKDGTNNNTCDVSAEKITVIIDAGHGGEDGGAIGSGNIYEKDINLSIALKIGKKLEENGINILYTRTTDILLYDRNVDFSGRKKALDLAARVKTANETPNCIFVSIHMNSFPQSQYSGLQVYYSKNSKDSQIIAASIQNSVKANLQPQNKRKITEATSRIYLLDRIQAPAVLIECGFLSNPEECRLLTTEIYQNQLAEIISKELEKYVEKNLQTY